MYPSGKTDMLSVEGTFVRSRSNVLETKTEWLIDANAYMDRTGLKDNLNPGFIWAEENLCLKADGSN